MDAKYFVSVSSSGSPQLFLFVMSLTLRLIHIYNLRDNNRALISPDDGHSIDIYISSSVHSGYCVVVRSNIELENMLNNKFNSNLNYYIYSIQVSMS